MAAQKSHSRKSRIVLTRSLNINWLCLWRLESKLAENFKTKGLRVKQEWSRGEGEELHIYTFYWVFEVYKQFPFCSTFNIRNESSYLHFKDLCRVNQGWPFEFIFMTTLCYVKRCCHFHRSGQIKKYYSHSTEITVVCKATPWKLSTYFLSETSIHFYQVPGVTTQKTVNIIVTAFRTSHLETSVRFQESHELHRYW